MAPFAIEYALIIFDATANAYANAYMGLGLTTCMHHQLPS